jgi:hypothetical protein
MKLKNISKSIVDLSDNPTVALVSKLRKNDLVVHDGLEWNVEFAPKKVQKGVWWIGLRNGESNKYVRVIEDMKPKMTAHEKKTMVNNIKGVVKMLGSENKRLEGVVRDYYSNLSTHNNYDDKDVRDCMTYFPVEALKRAGIAL